MVFGKTNNQAHKIVVMTDPLQISTLLSLCPPLTADRSPTISSSSPASARPISYTPPAGGVAAGETKSFSSSSKSGGSPSQSKEEEKPVRATCKKAEKVKKPETKAKKKKPVESKIR